MAGTFSSAVPVRVIRYGVDAPLPERRLLRAGSLTAVLENGDLRYVRAGDVEIVRRLYMAVRDQNWDTIEPRYTSFSVDDRGDAFTIRFTAEHVKADVDFAWKGIIEGTSDGTISYAMDGAPRKSFLRNRIGFCVLHPMDLAGEPVEVETPSGMVRGEFPRLISPHQPFLDMVAISHAAGPSARVTIRFEGDLFEMEDQRNWTDASYKTYCTPLRLPYPVRVEAGQRIVQKVTLSLSGSVTARTAVTERAVDVEVGQTPVATLPALGFGVASHGERLSGEEIARLRRLKPSHLWLGIDLGAAGWEALLRQAAEEAAALGCGLELSVIAATDDGFDRLAAVVPSLPARVLRVFVFPPVSQPVVFPRHDLATTAPVMATVRAAFARAGVETTLGGGTRAYFTELNRASETLPLDQMEVVTYTINPQVHAFDNLSLVETLAAQAETVRSAKAIVGDLPLAIGPITLKPPFNPNATGPEPEPGPDELPTPVDPRQLSLFGAGWTLGSISRLAAEGVASLTYYETTGWRGVIERPQGAERRHRFPSVPGQQFPLFHVFAAVADFAGGHVLPVTLSDPLATEALALQSGQQVRILVANFEDATRTVRIAAPDLTDGIVTYLDETTAQQAMTEPDLLRSGGAPVHSEPGTFTLALRPFAVACVTGRR